MINFYSANLKVQGFWSRIFSGAIKFFTAFEYPAIPWKEGFSHNSLNGDTTSSGDTLIFQSSLTQELNYWDSPTVTFYLLNDGEIIQDVRLFHKIAKSQVGKPYGFLQIIDFIRVWYYNKLFKRDPKNVWFPQNRVCSEQAYTLIMETAVEYNKPRVINLLRKYNSNLYSPMRIYRVCKQIEAVGDGLFFYNV